MLFHAYLNSRRSVTFNQQRQNIHQTKLSHPSAATPATRTPDDIPLLVHLTCDLLTTTSKTSWVMKIQWKVKMQGLFFQSCYVFLDGDSRTLNQRQSLLGDLWDCTGHTPVRLAVTATARGVRASVLVRRHNHLRSLPGKSFKVL